MEMKKNFGALITPEIEATLKELKRGIPKAPIDTESVETLKAFDEILSGIEGWESSTSQREQREIDSLTDELDAFIADAFKEDESPNDPKVVSWDDIELKDELPTIVTTDTPWQTVCDFGTNIVVDLQFNKVCVKQKRSKPNARTLNAFL